MCIISAEKGGYTEPTEPPPPGYAPDCCGFIIADFLFLQAKSAEH